MDMLGHVQQTLQTHGGRSHIFAWHYGPFPMNLSSQSQSVPVSSPIFPSVYKYRVWAEAPGVHLHTAALAEHRLGLWALGKLLCGAWGCRKLCCFGLQPQVGLHTEIFSRPIKKSVCASLVELICG